MTFGAFLVGAFHVGVPKVRRWWRERVAERQRPLPLRAWSGGIQVTLRVFRRAPAVSLRFKASRRGLIRNDVPELMPYAGNPPEKGRRQRRTPAPAREELPLLQKAQGTRTTGSRREK